jgi:hypothetical protein
MKNPRLMARTAVTAATLATALGLFATTASAAPVTERGNTATAARPAAQKGALTSAVTGTFSNADGQGTFVGTFTPQRFSVVNGVLDATGLLQGTMTDANGSQLGTVSQTATIPVDTTAAAGDAVACNILNLTLGPLNLDLLGLVVTLNQIHLTITAVPGPGNLLGNLLCAVANLLDGTGSLSAISALLNEILALL